MSFKLDRFFYLTLSFIIGCFFLVTGLFSLILPWSSSLKAAIEKFILENDVVLSLFGIGFTAIGISIIIYACLNTRHRYIELKINQHPVCIDEKIIRQYLEVYWKEHFYAASIPFDINLKSRSLEIIVEFPFVSLAEQKKLLERTKNDFDDLFGRLLGYPYDVHLFASFQADDSYST